MKRAWIAWACAAGIATLCAGVASSASALEIGRCVASPGTGKYKTATCTTKAGSNPAEKAFEFQKNAVKKKFTMAGSVWLMGTQKDQKSGALEWLVSCSHQAGAGEYRETGSTPATKSVWHLTESWTECEVSAQHAPVAYTTKCQSAGQPSGTIVSGTLAGKLGYIAKAKPPVVGLELHPESKGGNVASFECAGFGVVVQGCVIGEFAPPDEMQTYFHLNYSARILLEPYEQIPHAFAGSPHTCVLASNLPDPFFVVGGSTVTNEEPLELKA